MIIEDISTVNPSDDVKIALQRCGRVPTLLEKGHHFTNFLQETRVIGAQKEKSQKLTAREALLTVPRVRRLMMKVSLGVSVFVGK